MTSAIDATSTAPRAAFFGPRVVRAAFVLAFFGWGIGFYGPAIFLREVIDRTGWPLATVSLAVTVHHLFGAAVVTQLPRWHRRFGVGLVAVAGALAATAGLLGWALAAQPWQLFAAALASGGGWVTMGAVAVNAAIAPWYVRRRPVALAQAYNGASIGGVVFSPLWVALIGALGFASAVLAVGAVMVAVVAVLARRVFAVSPQQIGQRPDGAADAASAAPAAAPSSPEAPRLSWRDRAFRSLAVAMALSLFAQIGLLAHLYALLAPALGAGAAGWVMGGATACAIAGRWLMARWLLRGMDRRRAVAAGIAVQALGVVLVAAAGDGPIVLLLAGVMLFGSGIGNATTLPPLIAQAEFAAADVPRAVATIVAAAQATYAFAPALYGALLAATGGPAPRLGAGALAFLAAVAAVQLIAAAIYVAGRRR